MSIRICCVICSVDCQVSFPTSTELLEHLAVEHAHDRAERDAARTRVADLVALLDDVKAFGDAGRLGCMPECTATVDDEPAAHLPRCLAARIRAALEAR